MSNQWRHHAAIADAILERANDESHRLWRLESRLAGGILQGAWRVREASTVAVLKWHDPTRLTALPDADFNVLAPYNPDAPAIVDYVKAAGYPTPAWLAAGTTDDGIAWSIQELVDGEPLDQLDSASAEVFIELVRLHRSLRLPTTMSWNPYVRAHVFGAHPSHQPLKNASDETRRLLDDTLALAEPHEPTTLVDNEMVHCDLNVSNVLMRDGRVVAVVDIDGAGNGCAVYDLLSPAVNAVWWNSDPAAIDRLVSFGIDEYGPGPIAIAAACLVIETTGWYLQHNPTKTKTNTSINRQQRWISHLRARLR